MIAYELARLIPFRLDRLEGFCISCFRIGFVVGLFQVRLRAFLDAALEIECQTRVR